MFRPHEGARLYTRVLLESQEGRGIGMFAKENIPCGALIVDEVNTLSLQFIKSIYNLIARLEIYF